MVVKQGPPSYLPSSAAGVRVHKWALMLCIEQSCYNLQSIVSWFTTVCKTSTGSPWFTIGHLVVTADLPIATYKPILNSRKIPLPSGHMFATSSGHITRLRVLPETNLYSSSWPENGHWVQWGSLTITMCIFNHGICLMTTKKGIKSDMWWPA